MTAIYIPNSRYFPYNLTNAFTILFPKCSQLFLLPRCFWYINNTSNFHRQISFCFCAYTAILEKQLLFFVFYLSSLSLLDKNKQPLLWHARSLRLHVLPPKSSLVGRGESREKPRAPDWRTPAASATGKLCSGPIFHRGG